MRKWVGDLILCLFAFGVPFFSTAVLDATENSCAEILAIFARGSGQFPGDAEEARKSKPQLNKFFQEIEKRKPSDTNIAYRELEYPAAGGGIFGPYPNIINPVWLNADLNWNAAGAYHSSVNYGVAATVSLLNQQIQQCPNQQFVLGGYSQGAHVMGDVLYQVGDRVADNIAYVGLFGDPKFNPFSYAARGDFVRPLGGVLEPRSADFPEQFRGRVQSWCRQDDGICENNLLKAFGPLSTHSDYTEREITIAVNEAAIMLRSHFAGFKSLYDIDRQTPVDLMFVIDATSNHQNSFANFRAYLDIITAQLTGSYEDIRFGYLEYKDFTSTVLDPTELGSSLTSDRSEFLAGVDRLSRDARGGGGVEEAVYSGVMRALAQNWRPDSYKAIILLPYSAPRSPEPNTGYVLPSVIDEAYSKGGVHVYVGLDNATRASASLQSLYGSIAGLTGGRIFSNFIFGNLGYGTLQFAQTLPTDLKPFKNYSSTVLADQPSLLSVADVFDPDSLLDYFEWDFDGDGVYDVTSSVPAIEHSFASADDGRVIVRIASRDGGKAVITQQITVASDSANADLPGAVAALNYSTEGSRVTITWEAPENSETVEGYLIYSNGELMAVLPANETGLVLHEVLEGTELSVRATNFYGVSVASTLVIAPLVEAVEELEPEEAEELIIVSEDMGGTNEQSQALADPTPAVQPDETAPETGTLTGQNDETSEVFHGTDDLIDEVVPEDLEAGESLQQLPEPTAEDGDESTLPADEVGEELVDGEAVPVSSPTIDNSSIAEQSIQDPTDGVDNDGPSDTGYEPPAVESSDIEQDSSDDGLLPESEIVEELISTIEIIEEISVDNDAGTVWSDQTVIEEDLPTQAVDVSESTTSVLQDDLLATEPPPESEPIGDISLTGEVVVTETVEAPDPTVAVDEPPALEVQAAEEAGTLDNIEETLPSLQDSVAAESGLPVITDSTTLVETLSIEPNEPAYVEQSSENAEPTTQESIEVQPDELEAPLAVETEELLPNEDAITPSSVDNEIEDGQDSNVLTTPLAENTDTSTSVIDHSNNLIGSDRRIVRESSYEHIGIPEATVIQSIDQEQINSGTIGPFGLGVVLPRQLLSLAVVTILFVFSNWGGHKIIHIFRSEANA
ncbi:cutinase family protein [Candidatus Microgenomates bacterium]|nr:cutinase family protein [Candidatus Microgenomates bacterium]